MSHRLTLSGNQKDCVELMALALSKGLDVVEFDTEPVDYSDFKVFISYRREDSADIAGRIYDHLVWSFSKFSVFFDVESIPVGEAWEPILQEQASACSMMIAIIGDSWLTSTDNENNLRLFQDDDFVRLELEIAQAREDIPVVPILVKGATLPSKDELPKNIESLSGRQAIELRSGIHFRQDVIKLVEEVKTRFDILRIP